MGLGRPLQAQGRTLPVPRDSHGQLQWEVAEVETSGFPPWVRDEEEGALAQLEG